MLKLVSFLVPASAIGAEVTASAMEVKPLGRGRDTAGAAVPVGVGLSTGSLGLPLDITAGAPGRDLGGTGSLNHGKGSGESGDEEENNLVEGHC